MSRWLYAVADRSPEGVEGLDPVGDGPVVLLGTGLGDPSEEALRRFDRTVRAIEEGVGAVLPARFGQPLDETGARRWVERERSELRERLARVRGRRQMTVRVWGRHPRRAPGPTGDDAGPGRRYLAERASERLDLERPPIAPVRAAVAGIVTAERVRPGSTEPLVAPLHHLVADGDEHRYRSAVAGAEVGNGWRATVSGPAPPYAFAGKGPG